MKVLYNFFLAFVLFGTSCNNNSDIEIIMVGEKYDESILKIIFEVNGWKYDSIQNIRWLDVSRTINTSKLEFDSLCYFVNKQDWYSGIPMEDNYEYYVQMSLLDIDTSNFNVKKSKSVADHLFIELNMLSGKKIKVSKVTYDGSIMKPIWTVSSDFIQLDYPISIERIKNEFDEYNMFEPSCNCKVDYVKNDTDSINIQFMGKRIIKEFKLDIENRLSRN